MRFLSLNGEFDPSSLLFTLQIQIYLHQHRELRYLRPWLRLVWCSRICRCGRRWKKLEVQISRYRSVGEAKPLNGTPASGSGLADILTSNHVNQPMFNFHQLLDLHVLHCRESASDCFGLLKQAIYSIEAGTFGYWKSAKQFKRVASSSEHTIKYSTWTLKSLKHQKGQSQKSLNFFESYFIKLLRLQTIEIE